MSQINPQLIIDKEYILSCEFTKVQQVGIDLTLSEEVKLKHGESKNVLLNEKIRLPIHIFSTFTHRSTYNRQGILITGSIYDPGYSGQVGCTIYNLSGGDLEIDINERIGQMVFFEADAASEYDGQYQNEFIK